MPATIQTIQKPTRARALDTSGNNNHGQIYSGRGLEFDGVADYLDTNYTWTSNTISICAWLYTEDNASQKIAIGNRTADNDGVTIAMDGSETVRWEAGASDCLFATYNYLNQWVRVCAVYDKANTLMSLYINGRLANTTSADLSLANITGTGPRDFVIGSNRVTLNTNMFVGRMSDVQLWDAAFNADDALYDYLNPEQSALNRGGTSLTNSNLKVWYPMNDGHRGQQSYILDASDVTPPNKNHATTVFYGDNLIPGVSGAAEGDFEDTGNTPTFAATYAGGSGSGITYDADNTSSPLTGSKDGKVTNAAGENAGVISNAITLVTGRTYKVGFNYLTNYNASSQTNKLRFKIGQTQAHDSTNIDNAGGYAATDSLDATSKTAYSQTFVHTDSDTEVFIVLFGGNGLVFQFDDIYIKEEGIATGWTDADQQLDIPQIALQSYNQLAMPQGASNHQVNMSDGDSDMKFTTGDFTISFWFQPNSTKSGYVFSKGAFQVSGYYIYWHGSSYKLQYITNQSSANQAHNLDNTLTLGKWYHCAIVIDNSGTDSVWYINGEKESEETSHHTAPTADTRNVQIYNRGGGSGNPDFGLTEISVWNKALGPTEINELYNDGKALNARNHSSGTLLHYWRNNGLGTWTDIGKAGSLYDGTPANITETMLITAGADGSRDSQGFLMNRKRTTNSLNNDYQENTATIGGIGHYVDTPGFNFHATVFSISCWIKSDTMSSNETILDKYYNTQNQRAVRLYITTSGELKFQVSDDGSSNESQLTTDADLVADTWYHIVVTYSSGTFTAYRNGTALSVDANFGTETSIDQNTAALRIGMSQDTKGSFNGQIDDLCIYDNKVLSAAEVTRNYNAGKRSHR